MKKSKKIILVVVAIVAILVSFLGGQAYAKYMSKVTGNGTAEIASWKFKVNENEEKMQTISLSSTINNLTLANRKVAPGTSGSFQINLDSTDADVGVMYTINFENETQKPTNLKFEYLGETYDSLGYLRNVILGTIFADAEDKTKTITIGWKWDYETGSTKEEIEKNNKIDTEESKYINDYTFDIVVTGTQVRPQG